MSWIEFSLLMGGVVVLLVAGFVLWLRQPLDEDIF